MHLIPAVRCKSVVLLLLMHCFMYLTLFMEVLRLSLFCYAFITLCPFLFCNYLDVTERSDASLKLSFWCFMTSVLWLFRTAPWVGLQCVIVEFIHRSYSLFSTALVDIRACHGTACFICYVLNLACSHI